MKTILFSLTALFIISTSVHMTACSQRYTTAADTVKLNEKWVKVSNEIAELTANLSVAQNDLPGLANKANAASNEARSTAANNSTSASNATGNSVKDAKKAEKQADKALDKAKDAQDADKDVARQQKKIEQLSEKLRKKQAELQELEAARNVIRQRLQH